MSSDTTRRDVLRGIGAVGTASTAAMSTSIVSAGQQQLRNADEESIEQLRQVLSGIDETSGLKKKQLVDKAGSERTFRKLENAILRDNNITREDVTVYHSEELSHYFVVFTYASDGGRKTRTEGELLIPVKKSNGEPTIELGTSFPSRAVVRSHPRDGGVDSVQEMSFYQEGVNLGEYARFEDVHTSSVRVNGAEVSKISVDEMQTLSGGWGCAACKDMVGLIINTLTCSISSVLACSVITSGTGVGPLACAAAFGIICAIIYNEGINDPDNVCGGCDMWGNPLFIKPAPCSDCDDCSWLNPFC